MSLTRNILFSTTSAMLVMSNVALADVTLDTKYGKVTVKDDVKNVVTLHEGALDVMSAINFKVAGSVATRGSDTVSRYLAERQPNIDIVGTARETNLEAVINERPDVILASPSLSQEQYNMLSKIAPTIVPIGGDYSTPFNWKAEARLFGKAVSREADVEKAITAVEERAATIKQKVEQAIPADQRTAYVARWMPQGPMAMSKNLFAGTLLAATGFTAEDGGLIKAGRPHSSILSLENISAIDHDWLFLATLNEDGKAALNAAKDSPAFSRLNVVQKDHVATVDGQVWSSTSGPLAAHVVLDDIESLVDNQ